MQGEEKRDVLLVGMWGILGEIVREIVAQQSDMEIVGEVGEISELQTTERLARTGVVVVRSDDEPGLAAQVDDLLGSHPRLTVLTVHDDGRTGSLYRLRPEKLAIRDLSPGSLVKAIRARTPSRAPAG